MNLNKLRLPKFFISSTTIKKKQNFVFKIPCNLSQPIDFGVWKRFLIPERVHSVGECRFSMFIKPSVTAF